MSLELDHVFVLVSEGAPEAEKLKAFGLLEGEPNVHPGQGTSNRRFFFSNMMLELLWVSNMDEVKSELTKPTMLWERWTGRNSISPFGLAFRTSGGDIPVNGWEYKPEYLPEGFSFLVGQNSGVLNEPMIFVLPAGGGPARKKAPQLQSLSGFNQVSSLRINMPDTSSYSSVLRSIACIDNISFKESENHVMEIGFNGEAGGKSESFLPDLPLVFKW